MSSKRAKRYNDGIQTTNSRISWYVRKLFERGGLVWRI